MQKVKIIFLFSLVTIVFASCKKETLQPGNTNGAAVFAFSGTVNGLPVSLSAGVNNYYMYSSYIQASDSVYSFISYLHQVGCTNCTNSIQFLINDYKKTNPGGSVASWIDTSLKPASYPFITPTGGIPTSFSVTYTDSVNVGVSDSVTRYSYLFGDGSTASTNSASITHIYQNPGTYTTTLTTYFNAVAPDTIQNVTIAANTGYINTSCYIHSVDTSGNAILEDHLIPSATNYTVNWNYGDGHNELSSYIPSNAWDSCYHMYSGPNGLYVVTASATDANNNKNTSIIKVNPNSLLHNYNTQLKSSVTPLPNHLALSNITVVYTDGSGNVYSSANITAQPNTSNFQITQLSSYQNNENNQTTKMLHITFTCQLKDNTNNQTISITNGTAVIAVAYK